MNKKLFETMIILILFESILNKDTLFLEINKSNNSEFIRSTTNSGITLGQFFDYTHLVVSLYSEDVPKKIKPVYLICLVDISFSMLNCFDLVKKSLIYLTNLLNEQDSLSIVTISEYGYIITNSTKMTSENKNIIIDKINNLEVNTSVYYDYWEIKYKDLVENIDPEIFFKLGLLNKDYSSGETVASILRFSDGQSSYLSHAYYFNSNNTFTLHSFQYDGKGNSMKTNWGDGGYYLIKEESMIPEAFSQLYGALSTVNYVNIELLILSNYYIKEIVGLKEMNSERKIYYDDDDNDKNYRIKLNQIISGKRYTFNILVYIPQNIPLGSEVLNATILPIEITSHYFFGQDTNSTNSLAYEEFFKSVTYKCLDIVSSIIYGDLYCRTALEIIRKNYKGQKNWEKVINDAYYDFADEKNISFHSKNYESKARSLIYSPFGIYFTTKNAYQSSIIHHYHQKNLTTFKVIKDFEEKRIKIEEYIFFYYFILKEGIVEINNMFLYEKGTNVIIYSEDTTENINIKSLSNNLELYYSNEFKTKMQMDIDYGNGGIFMIKKDFPFEFYSWTDGFRDITFNIEFLKLECEGNSDIIVHLFEIIIYILNETEIKELRSINDLSNKTALSNGFYDEKLKLGKVVIRKEKIQKYIENSYNYLYVVVKKKEDSKIIYKYIEGKFLFVSMDYISSPIPEDFYIFSNLSKEKKYHLYTCTMDGLIGKYIRIEFGTSSNEIDCRILKYQSYPEDSEEIYVDFNEYNITRTKNKDKTYIDVFQSIKEENKIEYIIVSIIFINIKNIDILDTSDYSYTLKYNSYSYNQAFNNYVNSIDSRNGTNSNGTNTNTGDTEIGNLKAKYIFLGFARFKYIRSIKIAYFYIYFASIIEKIQITEINLYIKIRYKTNLESLQNESKNIKCLLFDNEFSNQNQFRYNCSFETNGEELENIEVIENNFDGQNLEVIGNSPMAIHFMDNLQNINDTDIFNKKLYIFKDSTLQIDYNKNIFNITGIIYDINFNYVSLYLTIIIITFDNSKQIKNIYCDIINLNDDNYRLVCDSGNETYLILNGAFANLGEKDNLVINFNSDVNSTILFNSSMDYNDKIILNIKNKKSKKMSAPAIIGIILPSVFVIIVIVIIIIIIKKQPVQPIINSNTDNSNLDINIK